MEDAIGERIAMAKIIKQPSVQPRYLLQGLLDFFNPPMYAGDHSGHLTRVAQTGSMNEAVEKSRGLMWTRR